MSSHTAPFPLSLLELRLLGVLVEKQKTTADAYPMTVNALVAGANQKSNRDPILSVASEEVEETLDNLNRRGLVVRVQSGRVDKWKHVLYEHWELERIELAIVAELFLRGPQTEGELRGHVSRMDDVPDLDVLRPIVKKLSDRGFVIYLTPEGRRGTVVTHGFQDQASVERQRAAGPAENEGESPRKPADTMASHRPINFPKNEIDELRKEMAELRLTVGELTRQLNELRHNSGTEHAIG